MFVGQAPARGRSFAVEITGTILGFNRATQIFTIQVDQPTRILTIAVGRNCKFIQNGVSTGDQILKKAARVRVSYFATIFTGNIAVKIETNPLGDLHNCQHFGDPGVSSGCLCSKPLSTARCDSIHLELAQEHSRRVAFWVEATKPQVSVEELILQLFVDSSPFGAF
jgi:hypothetical protein